MSLFDSLRKASWRGFEFAIESDEKAFGRDIARHKIINGQAVEYEDIGTKERAFTVEAVIGGTADFIGQADQFEALLAQKGTGRLVLPHTGEMTAVVTDARRRHSSREVGIVYFSITFERVDRAATGAAAGLNSASGLIAAVESANSSIFSDFLKAYQDGAPDFVTDAVMGRLGDYTGDLATRLQRAGAVFSLPTLTAHAGRDLVSGISGMFQGLLSRFTPKLNFSVATDNIPSPAGVPALAVLKALTGTASGESVLSIPPPAVQNLRTTNTEAADLLMRLSTTAAAANAAAYASFESKQDALRTRADTLAVMHDVRLAAGESAWVSSYTAIGSLMAALNRDIDEKLGRLPATLTVQPTSVRSSMALAHRLFGDNPGRVVDLASDIVRRNAVLHPSFLSADPLEVLADA